MAGIYIHIPFCSSRCIYCDFYSTTLGKDVREKYVHRLCDELSFRSAELKEERVKTIYFGGGTPSLLSLEELKSIFVTLKSHFDVMSDAEITLESNPDDVTTQIADGWRQLGINRVSLGLQTFHDDILKILRRRHSSSTAYAAVDILKKSGITNLSLDLIYGLPHQTFDIWKEDVNQLLDLDVNHLSAYALSYEEGTVLKRMLDSHEIEEASDEEVREMYRYLVEKTSERGYKHYEISNFCLPGFHSRHNSSYWDGLPYLGVGPGAHSYDGRNIRRANLPDLNSYLCSTEDVPFQIEELNSTLRFEEYIMTGLRTVHGISLSYVEQNFGHDVLEHLRKTITKNVESGFLEIEGDKLRLTLEGIFISDYIMSDLMLAGDI